MRNVTIPYTPRALLKPFHNRNARWAIIVAHRRFGKTIGTLNDLIRSAVTCTKANGRFAYIAPTYSQAKDIAWEPLKRFSGVIPGVAFNESELRADFPNGSRIRLYGSDNYDRMRGGYFDSVIMDEYGDQHPSAWHEVVRPALSDRKGTATFIGTPKGDNHFKKMWQKAQESHEWFKLMIKASESGVIDEQELHSARREMSVEQYETEYECSFEGQVVGSYYGEALRQAAADNRVGDFSWLPEHVVHTAWDTGGTTACWFFQRVNSTIRVIDYMEGVNQSADWYVRELRGRPYTYGSHLLPSDSALEKEIVGKSWKQSFEELGVYGWLVLKKQSSKNEGINQARLLIRRCQFNANGEKGCNTGYTALLNYRREWDSSKQIFKNDPFHNWASHGADAFRYLAVGLELIDVTGSGWSKPIAYSDDWL